MRTLLLTIATLFTLVSTSHAWIDRIGIDPFMPAPGDSVTVTVYGIMPNSCWQVVDSHCYGAGGQEITIDIETYDFGGRPLDYCLMVLKRYQVSCTYRLPTAGPYTVVATETCDSLNPCTGGELTFGFRTKGAPKNLASGEATAWSAIKACYR